MHQIPTFIAIILHTLSDSHFRGSSAFTSSLSLLFIQGSWLYFITVTWMYRRESTNILDVPQFVQVLRRKRRKAIQKNQRERFGHLPMTFLGGLVAQIRGLASVNVL
ncbi:hypothetical protein Trydic_g5179 [Trypoxylus dichotomus]